MKVVRYVEALTEDLTGLQMVHRFAHLVSADQRRSPSVGCIGVIEEDLRWDRCLVVVASNHSGRRVYMSGRLIEKVGDVMIGLDVTMMAAMANSHFAWRVKKSRMEGSRMGRMMDFETSF